jgi:epoxyqueuosine reductase
MSGSAQNAPIESGIDMGIDAGIETGVRAGGASGRDPAGAAFFTDLARRIKAWGRELGFAATGITGTELEEHETRLLDWLQAGRHGEMDYMARHGSRRSRPQELVPGTLRVISVRMDYLPPEGRDPLAVLDDPLLGYVSRYALGRDYHKVLRARLQALAARIAAVTGPFGYRAFTDSAPVLEKALAERAGLGWIGKHTNLIDARAGSWFFLGELYTDLPLPVDTPAANHCGSCRACIDVCPTQAIVAPYELDARRCISYLTIELRGPIPVELRPLIGNRIFGCDDCQLVCPWNRFARHTTEGDFRPRHDLDAPALVDLFAWSEAEFLQYTAGSAIRRIGHGGWLRNIAVALGNALRRANGPDKTIITGSLMSRRDDPSELVREHVRWALEQQAEGRDPT